MIYLKEKLLVFRLIKELGTSPFVYLMTRSFK